MGQLTVITPPVTGNLVSIDDLRDEIDPIDTSLDRYYGNVIARASRAIANYCHRVFGRGTYSEVFALDWREGWVDPEQRSPILQLARFPVLSITSIIDRYSNVIDPTTYYLNPESGIIMLNTATDPSGNIVSSWTPQWGYPVTVLYQAGYDLTLPGDGSAPTYIGAPPDLATAALALCVQATNTTGSDSSVQYELTENVGRTQYFDRGSSGGTAMGIDTAMAAQLAAYKVYR